MVVVMLTLCSWGCEPGSVPGRSRLTVFDGITGQRLWSAQREVGMIEVAEFSPPDQIAAYGFNPCRNGSSETFQARTGEPLPAPPQEGYPIPAVYAAVEACQRILVSTDARGMQRFDSLVATVDDSCFFSHRGELVAVRAETGRERFRVPSQSDWLLGLDTHVLGFSGSTSTNAFVSRTVRLFSNEDGRVLWEVPLDNEAASLALTSALIVTDATSSAVRALSWDDGRELWRGSFDCDYIEHASDFLVCIETLREATCKYPD